MRLRSFVDEGYFNDVIALNEDIPLAPTQGELIPIQREILLRSKENVAEEAQQQGAGGGQGVPQMSGGHRNSAHGNKKTQRRSFVNENCETIT